MPAEFLHWKAGLALAGSAQGGLESLEVSREGLDVALSAGDKVGIWHRLDLVILETFSNLSDSVAVLNEAIAETMGSI